MTRAARAWPYAAVAAAAALPFLRGPLSGHPLYFRDLSLHFLPLRRFVLEGLARGELRFWNPYAHEGEPLALPPIAYPLELLALLRPDEAGLSFLLALHVPLAAVWMMAFARHALGLSAPAAAAGAIVYALGGFALSTLNLYVYAQALAWAPAAMLGLFLAARGGRRQVALAALAIAVLVSTTAAEMAAQALLVGAVLALPAGAAGLGRMATAAALGAGLAAPVVLVVAHVAGDSARAAGFPADVVLAHSIHPLTLVQTVVAGFHGDTARLADRWWGGNFFPRGFPYFLSLYIGLAALCTAAVGALEGSRLRLRLAGVFVLGLALALGRWGLAAGIVDAVDVARRFRYPSKAFFAVHVAVALLCALGVEALARGAPRAWRRLAAAALAAGLLAASAPLWPRLMPAGAQWFAGGFFPSGIAPAERMALLDWVLRDAAAGGALAAVAGALAVLAGRGLVAPRLAAGGVVALVAADLVRAGAGLNPAVAPSFYSASPEIARHHAEWRAAGRVFTCDPASSRAYALGRSVRREHEGWTFAVLRDALVPSFNVTSRVASALSPDLTMLVPPERVLGPGEAGCADLARLIPPLRLAGVAHLLSLDPLDHPDLVPRGAESPPALAPVTVHAYALRDPLPPAEAVGDPAGTAVLGRDVPGEARIQATLSREGVVVWREGRAAGWQADVDGAPAAILPGRHLAVAVPAGAHTVRFRYAPPGLGRGVALFGIAAAITLALLAWPRRPARAAVATTQAP